MQYKHIDCFSGVGGICTGFHAAGFSTKIAIEYVDSCVDTYKENHPDVHVLSKDIRGVKAKEIREILSDNEIDIVTSGMPCETFSTAGSKSRSFYDHRQLLFKEGIRIAKLVNSKLILFENVVGIMSKKVKKESDILIIDALYEELEKAGYKNHISVVLNASDFGLPQSRERFFVLASKYNTWKLESPKENLYFKSATVRDAIIDIPNVVVNSGKEINWYNKRESHYSRLMKNEIFWKRTNNKLLTYHMPPNHREATIERFKLINPGEGLKDLFLKFTDEKIKELQEKHIIPKKYYIQRNRRLLLDSVSPTVTSHCIDELIHPIYNRALTVRECARLQGFPDSYTFPGGPYIIPHLYHIQDKYEQIGDAVPPLLAYAWGEVIKNILIAYNKKREKNVA